jgi:hypothetical protein
MTSGRDLASKTQFGRTSSARGSGIYVVMIVNHVHKIKDDSPTDTMQENQSSESPTPNCPNAVTLRMLSIAAIESSAWSLSVEFG